MPRVPRREGWVVKRKARGYGYTVALTVKGVKGTCEVGHTAGDRIVFDGYTVEGRMCFSAMLHLLPIIHAFAWGARFPWDRSRDITYYSCPDPENCVTFEIKRDRRRPWYVKKGSKMCLTERIHQG